jgi:hypothetical protein
MGSWLLAFLDNHSHVGNPSTSNFLHGVAAVARIPILNWPQWQRECPLLQGSSPTTSSFFLGFRPPFFAFILAGESLFLSVSARLSSKICFLVLVASLASGPPGKVAGGVAVIFKRRGGVVILPLCLKTTANPYLQPLAMMSQHAPETQNELSFPGVSGARGPSVCPSPQSSFIFFCPDNLDWVCDTHYT